MNRLAFSTLGCPEASLADVLRLAEQHGFAGVELRAQADQPVHVGLSGAERQRIANSFRSAGVTPISVASYVRVATSAATDEEVIDDGLDHLRLAADLGARYLRVFPGGDREPADALAQDQRAAQRLARLATNADQLGVILALETHDSHGRAQDVARVLARSGCRCVQVVWDVLHTWLGGETPAQSWAEIGAGIGYVQVKDVPSRDVLTPVLMGAGVLPLSEVTAELRADSYAGWISWEYERAWHPTQPCLDELVGLASQWMRQAFPVDSTSSPPRK